MNERYVWGIDIGTSNIKVFAGTLTHDGNIQITGSGIMPAAGFTKGTITDIQALAQSIKEAVDCVVMATDIPIGHTYLGIGGMGISSLNSKGSIAPALPDGITEEDIKRVYRAAVIGSVPEELHALHILPKTFWVDGQEQVSKPLNQKGSQLEVEAHIITMPKQIMDEFITAVENTGINVAGIIANSVVITQALAAESVEQPCLIIDMGAGITDLVLYHDRQIWQSASLPLGGDYITRDVMQGVDISHAHAEEVKRYYSKLDKQLRGQNVTLDCNDYGTTDKQVSYDFLHDIVESRVDEITRLVYDYLRPLLAEHNVKQILLTGGCAAMPSIRDSLDNFFKIPVHISMPPQLLAEYAYPGNSACFGILCYAANHLPAKEVPRDNAWHSLISKIRKLF